MRKVLQSNFSLGVVNLLVPNSRGCQKDRYCSQEMARRGAAEGSQRAQAFPEALGLSSSVELN